MSKSKSKKNTDNSYKIPTCRDIIKKTGKLITSGIITGCIRNENPADTKTNQTKKETQKDSSYTVTMSPVGKVKFGSIPKKVTIYDEKVANRLATLGQKDRIISLGFPDRYYKANQYQKKNSFLTINVLQIS